MNVTATEAAALLAEGAVLVDVREPMEWSAGRAAEAMHMPMAEVRQRWEELPRDRKVVVVCRSGSRSAAVARALAGAGLDAVNLTGGMHAWTQASLGMVADGGLPPRVA